MVFNVPLSKVPSCLGSDWKKKKIVKKKILAEKSVHDDTFEIATKQPKSNI